MGETSSNGSGPNGAGDRTEPALSIHPTDPSDAFYHQHAVFSHRMSSLGVYPAPRPPFRVEPRPALTDRERARLRRLPPPRAIDVPFGELLARRRSSRALSGAPLDLDELGTLLHAAYGRLAVMDRAKAGHHAARDEDDPSSAGDAKSEPAPVAERKGIARRVVPSAGGTYALDVYAVVLRGSQLRRGTYRYLDEPHALLRVETSDAHDTVADWLFSSSFEPTEVGAVLVITADLRRIGPRYGERAYRHVLLEAGHIGQNVALAATALELPHLPVGALDDRLLEDSLGLAPDAEIMLYGVAIGGR